MKKWLAGALFVSLSLNVALLGLVVQTLPSSEVAGLPFVMMKEKTPYAPASVPRSKPVKPPDNTRSSSALIHLNTMFEDNSPDFYPALSEALRAEPDNWDLLMLEAQWVRREQPLSEAIIYYYGLLERDPPPKLANEIRKKVPPLIDNALEKLRLAGDWDTLAKFIEPLFQYAPQNRIFIMQLAEAYGRQNKLTLMENILASVMPDDPQAEAIRESVYQQLAAREERDNSHDGDRPPLANNAFVMPLEQAGDHYLAPISLNGRRSSLLVDTGASMTTVTAAVFAQLRHRGHYRDLGKFTLNTAGGQVEARMVTLARVDFGPITMNNVTLMVLPENTLEGAEGLLGMNILKRFDFRIDQYQSTLLLNPLH